MGNSRAEKQEEGSVLVWEEGKVRVCGCVQVEGKKTREMGSNYAQYVRKIVFLNKQRTMEVREGETGGVHVRKEQTGMAII